VSNYPCYGQFDQGFFSECQTCEVVCLSFEFRANLRYQNTRVHFYPQAHSAYVRSFITSNTCPGPSRGVEGPGARSSAGPYETKMGEREGVDMCSLISQI